MRVEVMNDELVMLDLRTGLVTKLWTSFEEVVTMQWHPKYVTADTNHNLDRTNCRRECQWGYRTD
jgi:hypothetical protein